MEREFTLERVGASPSVFDPEKLLWMNRSTSRRCRRPSCSRVRGPHAAAGRPARCGGAAGNRAAPARGCGRRSRWGGRSPRYAQDPAEYDADGIKKHVRPETARQLERLAARTRGSARVDGRLDEAALRATAEAGGVSAGQADPSGAPRADRRHGRGAALRRRGAAGERGDPAATAPVPRGPRRAPRSSAIDSASRSRAAPTLSA